MGGVFWMVGRAIRASNVSGQRPRSYPALVLRCPAARKALGNRLYRPLRQSQTLMPYHQFLLFAGAAIMFAYWLPRFVSGRERAAAR